jgi:hypothetical protein
LRHNIGSGAAMIPARNTPSSAITLSTVLGSCNPTTGSACKPSIRRRAATAEMARSAWVKVSVRAVDALAIARIGNRNRVRMPHAGAAEEVIESRPVAAVAEDHDSAHQVSGR